MKQQLDNDMGLEMAALTILRPGIRTCMEAADDGSRELLEHILVDEEKHVDWIEALLHQINESALKIIWRNRSKRTSRRRITKACGNDRVRIYHCAATRGNITHSNHTPNISSWDFAKDLFF